MIGLLATAFLMDCVPLAQADRFGQIPFSGRVAAEDERFLSITCTDGECDAVDASGVRYSIVDGYIMKKTVVGAGPSWSFGDRLTAPTKVDLDTVRTASVCGDGVWVSLAETPDGEQYSLIAQP